MNIPPSPPRLAIRLLTFLAPPHILEDVLEGLGEEYARIHGGRGGRFRASTWYWYQVLTFSRDFRRHGGRSVHLGSPGQQRVPHEGGSLLRSLPRDLRFAVRGLLAAPGFSALALSALALGIGANTAIFSVVDEVLIRPLPFPEPETLVAVGGTLVGLDGKAFTSSSQEYRDYLERGSTLEELAASWPRDANLATDVEPERVLVQYVSQNFFSLLGVAPFLGRGFLSEDADDDIGSVVVVSHNIWQRHFQGDPSVLGKTLSVDGDPLTVIGVMPQEFEHPGETPAKRASLWVPLYLGVGDRFEVRRLRVLEVVGRLAPGASLQASQAQFHRIARELAQEYPDDYPQDGGWNIQVVPLRDRSVGNLRPSLMILLGAVVFVLLTACTNVAGLLLARGETRALEIAIRSALGGGRERIARQLFAESLVLASVAGVLGLAVCWACLEALRSFSGSVLPEMGNITLDGRVLAFTLCLSVLTCLVFGLLPAIRSSGANPQELLRKGVAGGRGKGAARRILATAQVAISVVLLLGAGLLLKSFAGLTGADRGFDSQGVLALQTSLSMPGDTAFRQYGELPARADFVDRALEALREDPLVEEAAVTTLLPFRGTLGWPFYLDGVEFTEGMSFPQAEQRSVNPSYFSAMGIPVLQGRGLAMEDDAEHQPVMVVDRQFADEFLEGDPLGRRIRMLGDEWREIVGVVGNVREGPLETTPMPHAYTNYRQHLERRLAFVLKIRGDPARLAASASAAVQRADPTQPVFAVSSMDGIIASALGRERLLATLVGLFAGLAVVLTAIGIYGVVSFTVNNRRREIGIRVALGAENPDVLDLALRDAARIAALGIFLGFCAAIPGTRLLEGILHEVSRFDIPTLALVCLGTAILVLLAGMVPAYRATRFDPLESIQAE